MNYPELNAISPIDGRYFRSTQKLRDFFSEAATIKYRVLVEVEYLIELAKIPLPGMEGIDDNNLKLIKNIYSDFTIDDAKKVKEIEGVTNHDIKAVEYFIKEKMQKAGLEKYIEFVHFGLTSQDINNTAFPLMTKDAVYVELIPEVEKLLDKLEELANNWQNKPMLAFTHGQPASPTTVGKELYVFFERINNQLEQLKALPFPGKFGGATGNFNAHLVAYPEINWVKFGNNFVENVLGLKRSRVTTQIDHYDNLSAIFDCLKRICVIISDLDKDMWTYISKDYFKQKIKENEVGSSAMPHKVNPIDFENSEGNLGIAIALFDHLSAKLPVSRLQRDLTDSTVIRNIGVPASHMLISIKSCLRGLNKIILNENAINKDLENNPMVIAEAIQTVLRRLNYPNPYEKLKELTRTNQSVSLQDLRDFINTLEIPEEYKERLIKLTPGTYTGYGFDSLIK